MSEYTSYTITVPKELWDQFKEVVPKSKTFNDAIVGLIKEKLEGRGE